MHMFMISTNFWKLISPMDLGNVIDKSQVDTRGRHSSVVKDILGVKSNPMAGILPAPEKNCRMSTRVTPCLPVGAKSKKDQLSKNFMWVIGW